MSTPYAPYYEFQAADHHFTEMVREVRSRGGKVTDKTIDLDGILAGYTYRPGVLKVQFASVDSTEEQRRPGYEHPLVEIINSARVKGVAGAWPPAPEVEDKPEEFLPPPPVEPDAKQEPAEVPNGPDGKPMPFNPPELAPVADEHKTEVETILAEGQTAGQK